MRRAAVLLLLLAFSLGLAGCGGEEVVTPTPETIVGTVPTATTTEEPSTQPSTEPELTGNAANGAKVFAAAGCGGCHTFEAAGSTGNVGPNLDDANPDSGLVVERVTNGQGVMPSFSDSLSKQEIADVAAYVSGTR